MVQMEKDGGARFGVVSQQRVESGEENVFVCM